MGYVVVYVWDGSCLGYPALLSSPVTLTLALSRRAGEGTSLRPSPTRASPAVASLPRPLTYSTKGQGESQTRPCGLFTDSHGRSRWVPAFAGMTAWSLDPGFASEGYGCGVYSCA